MITGNSWNCRNTSGMLLPSTRIRLSCNNLNQDSFSVSTGHICNTFSIFIRKYNIRNFLMVNNIIV